jgi:hypothetical protein
MKAMQIIGVAVLIVMLGGGMSFATSGYGWSAAGPSDAPYILHSGAATYNNDNAAAHWAVAGAETGIWAGFATRGADIFVRNNGLTMTCYLEAMNYSTGTVVNASGTTSVNGAATIHIALYTGAQSWTVSVSCFVPQRNSGTPTYVLGSSIY